MANPRAQLTGSANLPDPDIIAAEWSEKDERIRRVRAGLALVTRVGARAWAASEFQIVEDLQAALAQFAAVTARSNARPFQSGQI